MILLVHMLFGAAVASLTNNPVIAIVLAFLSHYCLDILPHVEYLESTENSITSIKSQGIKENKDDLIKAALDFFTGIALLWLLVGNQPLIYVAALVALIPDGMTVITHLYPHKLLKLHHKFHGGDIHYLTKQKNFPFAWKVMTQVAVVILSILILK